MYGRTAHIPISAGDGTRVCFESLPQAMRRIKKTIIEETLESCAGNRTRAAEKLGISRPNLQKTMKRLGIR